MLVRDFIHGQLYGAAGYFSNRVSPIISVAAKEVVPGNGIEFTRLVGHADYQRALHALYQSSGHWLTPVELFKPHYSQAVANWVIESHTKRKASRFPLRVIEIGAGNGTNANSVLNHIQRQRPDLYRHALYEIVEISPALAAKQREVLNKSHPGRTVVHNEDFLTWKRPILEPCAVVALEVLDNLAHDKIIVGAESSLGTNWKQVLVSEKDGKFIESSEPLTDELAIEAIKLFPPRPLVIPEFEFSWRPSEWARHRSKSKVLQERAQFEKANDASQRAAFVPSGCVKLLRVLRDCFPAHSLLLADFAWLPLGNNVAPASHMEGSLRGCLNSPIVSSRNGTEVRDHATYLIQESADIFFQTDFVALAQAWTKVTQREDAKPVLHASRDFLSRFAGPAAIAATTTRTGYNPMLEDFANTSFMSVN